MGRSDGCTVSGLRDPGVKMRTTIREAVLAKVAGSEEDG